VAAFVALAAAVTSLAATLTPRAIFCNVLPVPFNAALNPLIVADSVAMLALALADAAAVDAIVALKRCNAALAVSIDL
jgi:hypothetical protein